MWFTRQPCSLQTLQGLILKVCNVTITAGYNWHVYVGLHVWNHNRFQIRLKNAGWMWFRRRVTRVPNKYPRSSTGTLCWAEMFAFVGQVKIRRKLKSTDKDNGPTSPTIPSITYDSVFDSGRELSSDVYSTVGTGITHGTNCTYLRIYMLLMMTGCYTKQASDIFRKSFHIW